MLALSIFVSEFFFLLTWWFMRVYIHTATSNYIEQWKNMGINYIVNYKGNYTR